MLRSKAALCLSVLWIICAVPADTSIEVTQLPESVNAVKGTNVTFHCSIPFFQDNSQVSIDWWKEGKYEYLSTSGDNRKVSGFSSKFSGYLQIVNVSFSDAGIYYCAVKHKGDTTGSRVGSNLTVWVPPTALKTLSKVPGGGSSASLTLVCEAFAFYPGVVTFGWYKDGIEVTTGIHVIKNRKSEGLYDASSYLEEPDPAQSGTIYICLVSHITLETPAIVTHIVTYSDAGGQNFIYLLISGCIGYGLICLLFCVLIWMRSQFKEK
ncbi:immunoglobulin lambda-1 light chain-like [Heptranchias perlo]|uniref:immunoglobulin lambda-1 light chain-like n=1 Tax=Heptranchias perlo TaxID=212740 RepID=UPI003559DE5F